MPNDPSLSVSSAASIVGVISAVAAIISALLSFLSYKKASSQFEKNQKDIFIKQIKDKLDKCYIDLSEFIQSFTGSRETKEKRIVRDRIIYSLETIRIDISHSNATDNSIDAFFGDISLKISDVTYEKNFEKNMRDIAIIKDNISNFKAELIALIGY